MTAATLETKHVATEDVKRKLAEKIELFIFTYNRAPFLEETLRQLTQSPFSLCKITVVDNASTDGTDEVCRKYADVIQRFRHVKHRANLGCSANYLRAVEMSQGLYTWVLCDDDKFDFSKAGDVIEKILEGKLDLISVGVEGHNLRGGTLTTTRELALTQEYFLWHSFIPSLIFKTVHFDSKSLVDGYHNADTLLPHFPFVANMAEKNVTIYISREKVIRKGDNFGYAPLQFMVGWLRGSNKIEDPVLRRKCMSEVLSGKKFWLNTIFAILIETTFRKREVRREYRNFAAEARKFTPLLLLKIYMLLPLVLAPKSVHRFCWRKYEEYRARKNQRAPQYDADR
jgi:glycosyltransferase involved in cell wall biosynthesis